MKRKIIALMFLASMSLMILYSSSKQIPISRADTGPNTVSWTPVIRVFDPSTVPSSDPVASMPAGVASTYNIYPSTTSINTYYTFSNTWSDIPIVAILAPQATGHYDFFEYIYITNPSYKWACVCFIPNVQPTPYSIVSSGGFLPSVPSNSYLINDFDSNITWSGTNLVVWRVEIVVDVVSTSGVFNVVMAFNQLRTDINNDGIVNMRDIATVINHYGTVYTPSQARNDAWNVIQDFLVDYTDITAVVHEFNRSIPP